MSGIPEANIQFQLYHVLRDVIARGKGKFKALEFTEVKPEVNVDGGYADIVVYGKEDGLLKPFIVIETKRKSDKGVERYFDPYSPKVIDQAAFYAMKIGADYFITTNGEVLVSFQTFKTGVPLPDRRVKPYDLRMRITEETISRVLEDLAKIHIGVEKWLPLDEVFVNRLHTFHQFIMPYAQRGLKAKLDDVDFKNRYEYWLKSQFFDVSEETNEQIASQAAYILMNRILFYKTLEAHRTDLPRLHRIEYSSGGEFAVKLREHFKRVLDINYKAIFEEGILNEISIPNPLADVLNDFIEELDTYNLAKIQSDVIGRVYEDLIPSDERHRLGQYYTPPPIVDLIVEMTVKNPDDTVLDPGCGSGGFLVKSYKKLEELKLKENPLRQQEELHEDILDQLWGIDINQFPAHLASINLAVRNLDVLSRNTQVVVSDFFNVNPTFIRGKDGRTTIFGLTETTSLSGTALGKLPHEGFDVVVTNPPYTRQEEMEYKDKIREVALTYSDGSEIKLGAQAGIYAYFFTHSAKFLKNGGRMGYITSNTWLDVSFGEGLKKFFLDNFKILAIIEHDAAVFGRALVNTCIPILEKAEGNNRERFDNIVKFVRLKKAMDITKVVNLVRKTNANYEDDGIRIVSKRQEELQAGERWGKYIRAPAVYFKIIAHPTMLTLENFADVRFGIKTGANDFFILDKEKIHLWGIEKDYLKPVMTSIKELKSIELKPEDVKFNLLWVHGSKKEIRSQNVLKYIEYGEQMEFTTKRGTRVATMKVKGVHNLETCRQRNIWYDLGKRDIPPIIAPYMVWERPLFVHNKAKAFTVNTLHFVYPNNEEQVRLLLGILNSTLAAFLLEVIGRSYGGGVLKIEAYELKKLPMLDLAKLSPNERERIENALLKICDAQDKDNRELEDTARKELDSAVFDALALTEDERKQVYDGLVSLRNMRFQRKEVKVLVETEEGWKPPERHKTRQGDAKEPSKRLDKWI